MMGTPPSIMRVTLNGRNRDVRAGATVQDLIEELGLAPVRVAVEVNESLVPRAAYGHTTLRELDQIEVVTFVGGG